MARILHGFPSTVVVQLKQDDRLENLDLVCELAHNGQHTGRPAVRAQ